MTDFRAQSDDEPATDLAQQIADRVAPDWSAARVGGAQLDALRLIQDIADGFRSAAEPETAPPALFSWRHLQAREEIGRGAFGRVYRAWDPVLKRDVALKLVDTGDRPAADPEMVIAEARCLARVRHPNILAVHGAESADGRVGLWSDLLTGRTLQELLEDKGRLGAEAVIDLALPLADALALIHRRTLVHGDVKPANIMILDDATPVLMDFGAAREQGRLGAAALGSPRFMAPEQLLGAAPSPAGDLFALGVVLYQGLTGRFPWPASTLDELETAYGSQAAPDLGRLPRGFRRLVGELLAAEPERRPTASEVAERMAFLRQAPQRLRRRLAVGVTIASLLIGLGVALLALRTEKRTRMEVQTLRDLTIRALQKADPERTSGPTSVKVIYDALAEEIDSALTEDYPAARADVRLIVARGQHRLGDREAALIHYQRVLDETPADPRVFARRRCVARIGIASVGAEEKHADLAEAAALEALDPDGECAESMPPSQGLVARNALVLVYSAQGRWRDMLNAQLELLSDREALHGVGSLETAVDHHNLGTAYEKLGQGRRALEHGRRAAEILVAHGGEDSLRLGYVKLAIAAAHSGLGDFDEAQENLDEALRLYSANLPDGHRSLLDVSVEQARLWRLTGETARAEARLRAHLGAPEEPLRVRQLVQRNLAYLLIEKQEWDEAHELLASLRRSASGSTPLDSFYRAAESWTAARAGRGSPSSAAGAIEDAFADLERESLQGLEPYRLLERWRGMSADSQAGP
ncbi:MAG: protein kinase [Acidobacteriota bacterium]